MDRQPDDRVVDGGAPGRPGTPGRGGALELGKIYERLGDREKALAAYEEFVSAFDQPDPEVVALAEEGRQGVIRMQGLQRE